MNEYKRALRVNRSQILNDLQEDVIEDLLKLDVLSEEEFNFIFNHEDPSSIDEAEWSLEQCQERTAARVSRFLDIIEQKPEPHIIAFIDCLKEWYGWLHQLFLNIKAESIKTKLVNGGFPPLPLGNVTRRQLSEVRHALRGLTDNSFLVLHGLPGCGKTTLAVEALHDPRLVLKVFKGNVFWLTVGPLGKSDTIYLLENLNTRLQKDREPNLLSQPELALIQLRNKFLSHPVIKDCLIVLDDVHYIDESESGKVIESLNVGVRFLVTTNDTSVISKDLLKISKVIKVDDGFNENETRQLFSASTGLSLNQLPRKEVHDIHKACKGLPIMVSLIAAQLAEEDKAALGELSRWRDYAKRLSNLKRLSSEDSPLLPMDRAIEIAVNSLSPKLKGYFEHFVIFLEDVNINTEVLAIVWSLKTYEVEDIMNKFMKKSLVLRKWSEAHRSYVYGVHDLILDFLRKTLSSEKVQELHKNLVSKYLKKCDYKLNQLPRKDNYIFYFLGRHLRGARMFKLFPEIYWDFEFLEAKLVAVEPVELVRDLIKYKSYIVDPRNEESAGNYDELLSFIEWNKHWVKHGVDIAQLALQEPVNSSVYRKGLELAINRPAKVYIQFPLGPVKRKAFLRQTIDVKGDRMSYVCFANSENHIIVGRANGSIELWNVKCNKVLKSYEGHKGPVKHICLSSDGSSFWSSSMDGTVKRWTLASDMSSGDLTPSPSSSQSNYLQMWEKPLEDSSCEILKFQDPCIWTCVSKKSDLLATITQQWNTSRTSIIVRNRDTVLGNYSGYDARFCVFSQDDSYVLGGGPSGLIAIDLTSKRDVTSTMSPVNFNIIGLYTLLGDKIVTVSENRVDCWGSSESDELDNSHSSMILDQNAGYVLCHASDHIAVGTTKNDVKILDRETGREIQCIRGREKKKLLHISEKRGNVLAAYEDNTIDISPIEDSAVPKSQLSWSDGDNEPYLVTVKNLNIIVAIHGSEILFNYHTAHPVRRITSLSRDHYVAYAISNGSVSLVSPDGGLFIPASSQLLHLEGNVTLLDIFDWNKSFVVVASSEDSPVKVWFKDWNRSIELNNESLKSFGAGINSKGNLFTHSESGIRIWDLTIGSLLATLPNDHIMNPRASQLVRFGQNSDVFSTPLFTRYSFSEESDKCCFSMDGSKIGFIVPNGGVKVYDFHLAEFVAVHEWPDTVDQSPTSMAVSNSGDVCVGLNSSIVLVFTGRGVGAACLSAASIVPSSEPSKCAIADKFGDIHVLFWGQKYSTS